jgi:hypothetical protein
MHVFSFSYEGLSPSRVLVAEVSAYQSIDNQLEQIYKTVPAGTRSAADVLILRLPAHWSIDLDTIRAALGPSPTFTDGRLTTLFTPQVRFARAVDKPVHILCSSGYEHFITENLNPRAIEPLGGPIDAIPNTIEAIRIAELDFLIETGRALLPKADDLLYRAPSGRTMPTFLRVGNIQHSRAAIDAVFFWLLPYLRNCIGIVTDTWTISSISMNVSRRLAQYRDRAERACPVEMLSRYHDGSPVRADEAAEVVERMLEATAPPPNGGNAEGDEIVGQVLFLLSATHTGSLAARLSSFLQRRGVKESQVSFVAIFKLGSVASVPCLRDLSVDPATNDFEPTDDRGSDKTVAEIDDQVYFPLHFRDSRFIVRKREADAFCSFFECYRDDELFRVHKDNYSDGELRHHAVWLDTERLCRHPAMRAALTTYLLDLKPTPALILTPGHPAANMLADLAVEVLRPKNPEIRALAHPNLYFDESSPAEELAIAGTIDSVGSDKAILILDDAFVTGQRLQNYHTHMRRRQFRGVLHYLVAVARPDDFAKWEKFAKGFRLGWSGQSNTVHPIEVVVLPDWHEQDCPWCAELELYRKRMAVAGPGGEPSEIGALTARIALLWGRQEGLTNHLFLRLPGRAEESVTDGSIFVRAPASQATVFAAVAGAIQQLRKPWPNRTAPSLGPRRFPVSTVLAHEDYLGEFYTDPILQMSFLRAAKRDELVYTDKSTEAERGRWARNLVLSDIPTKSAVSYEVAFAIGNGGFPTLSLEDRELLIRFESLGISDYLKAIKPAG